MAKARGKTPTLISSSNGLPSYVQAKNKRTCKRCSSSILSGGWCAEVRNAGKFGHKVFCMGCFSEILEKSISDISELKTEMNSKLL